MRFPATAAMTIFGLACLCANVAIGDVVEDANWNRLRSMSRDQRLFLAKKLKSFDGLDPDEQQSIRKLDGEIQKQPPQNREVVYSVLRRYHLWLATLSDTERNELNALPPERKMERVRRLRKEQQSLANDYPNDLRPSIFGMHSPYEAATQVKTWLELTPDRKTALLNLKESDRARKLNEYRQELKIQPVQRPTPTLADEQFAVERWKAFRNQYNLPALKKFDDPANAEFQEKKARRLKRFAESRAFEARTVDKVNTDRLLEFATQMPPWYRSLYDRLSPELARQQLALLYRLVFPAPSEIPPVPPPGKAATKSSSPAKSDQIKKNSGAPVSKEVRPPVTSQPF